ncbi:MAG: ABC transporter permease [Deltaproteobacteria bacterium]|nr:ABC transporter permease [Deltaproteobacteria bacterium]
MTRVWVIAQGAFREAVRSKVFVNLLVLVGLMVLGGVIIDAGSIGDAGRLYHDIAHAAISISGSMVALFVGIQLVAADIERKTLHLLLARPVTRLELVVGKFLGLAGVLAVNTAIAALIYCLVALGGTTTALTLAGLVSILFLYFQFLVVGAISTMFSTLSGTTTAAVYSIALFTLGRLGGELTRMAERSSRDVFHQVAALARVAIPDLTRFDISPHVALPAVGTLGLAMLYALVWSLALLLLGAFAFSFRDLK